MADQVYVVSYGEFSEGTTVIAVKSTLKAAKAVALRKCVDYWDGKIPLRFAGNEFTRTAGYEWELVYSGCDHVLIQRWAVTT